MFVKDLDEAIENEKKLSLVTFYELIIQVFQQFPDMQTISPPGEHCPPPGLSLNMVDSSTILRT